MTTERHVLHLARLPEGGVELDQLLGDLEFALIDQAVERAGGNIAHAARLLGLNRTTLVERLRRLREGRERANRRTPARAPQRESAPAPPLDEADLNECHDWDWSPNG